MIDTKQQAYKSDFEKFLAHTDEKEILLREIITEAEKGRAASLLDIGAGNGLLSIPLAQHFNRYLAVEPKDSFVEKLRAAGLDTIHDQFPTPIQEEFDIVLASHSVSYNNEENELFVRAAWKLVTPRGQLFIVTYRGQEDDWTKLMKDIEENLSDKNRLGYNTLIMLLNSLGEVKARKVKTIVKTDSLDDMVDALSFVASDGIPERKERFMQKRERVERLLRSQYQINTHFEFPFWHYFVSTHK